MSRGFHLVSFLAIAGTASVLASCEQSPYGRDEFSTVVVDEYTFRVSKAGSAWVSWWVQDNFLVDFIPPLPVLKPKQIEAIERASGCNVLAAEYFAGAVQPAYLQASVDC
ncbi:hypothetical protein GCM10011358_00160 [Sinisalibacter lacisalsi]|uniref:Lipoprotein n=1 Tax=Sinisalibacter lacisalsi TaxID=1526570 RepID=A0ABQ1Q9Z9_9RHOB|nr:hypothetical protein GCM10011358_00160 [Sinisalibacter lacisalsi]